MLRERRKEYGMIDLSRVFDWELRARSSFRSLARVARSNPLKTNTNVPPDPARYCQVPPDTTRYRQILPGAQVKNKSWKEGLAALVQILTGLFETEKYHASQVQILIPHSRYLEEVEQASYKPNLKIGAIKEIQIQSIHKFKGLESEVVVMILPSIESLESETTTDIRSLIYVGMSRATSLLILIGDQEVKALANWSP